MKGETNKNGTTIMNEIIHDEENLDDNDDKNDDGEDNYYADVGFMFESQQPVRLETFGWTVPTKNSPPPTMRLTTSIQQQQQQQKTEISNQDDVYDHDGEYNHNNNNDNNSENDPYGRCEDGNVVVVPTTTTTNNNNNNNTIQVSVHVADDHPGAVQSGHYLWPAAVLLSEYIINHYYDENVEEDDNTHHTYHQYNNNNDNTKRQQPTVVIELGAGCGLVSLVAMQLWINTLQHIYITDHDPSTVTRARENYNITQQLQRQQLQLQQRNHDDDIDSTNERLVVDTKSITATGISSPTVIFQSLEWGNVSDVEQLWGLIQNHTTNHSSNSSSNIKPDCYNSNNNTNIDENNDTSDTRNVLNTDDQNKNDNEDHDDCCWDKNIIFVLGSDLIYCVDVVRPLLITAVQFLQKSGPTNNHHGRFILAQSFIYDEATEYEIDQICYEFHLSRTIVMDDFIDDNEDDDANTNRKNHCNGRIQEFSLKK